MVETYYLYQRLGKASRRIGPAVMVCTLLAAGNGHAAPPRTVSPPTLPRRSPQLHARDSERGSRTDMTSSPAELAHAERSLVQEATLTSILRLALARNPELAEARQRFRAAREVAPAASRLPDPEFEYQLWAQPLSRPVAFDEAQMHMFGIRQTFPAPGSLGARSQAASARADVAAEARRAREQELVARVRRAYAEYYRADRAYRIYLQNVRLTQQALELARAAYQGGRGSQQDVLRAAVELSRMHNQIATADRERRSARGLLNTLMARPTSAPLGAPEELQPANVELRADRLEQLIAERRPEIAAARSAIGARESEVAAARAMARWPNFMVGLQYMYMPMMEDSHNYGVMFSMSLPWFNPRYGEEVRAAEAQLSAERSALSSARYAARYELYDAAERLKAARESFTIIERDLLPQAQQSFESAQAVYRGGQADSLALFDALRSLLEVRIERERALSTIETAVADVERAVGAPISNSRNAERE